MRDLTRREWFRRAAAAPALVLAGAASSSAIAAGARGRAPPLRGPDRCFRQFNLDWSWIALRPEQIGEFLSEADPAAIAEFLRGSAVDGTVVMAVPHHGYCTHATRVGERFPALRTDWFGAMVEELHRRDIAAFAYVTLNWNWKFAREHVGADVVHGRPDEHGVCGNAVLICLNAPGYLELVEAYTREVLERYDVDGMRWDILKTARGCRCAGCRALFRELRGVDLEPDRPEREWADDLYDATIERAVRRLAGVCRALRPEVPIWQNHLSLYFPNPLDVVRELDIAYNEYGDAARLLLLAGVSGHPVVINGLMNQTPTDPPQPPDRRLWLTTLALGGRCYSYYGHKHTNHRTLLPDETIREWHRRHLAPLYREIVGLQGWFEDAVPVADVPLLYTDRLRRRYPNRTREPWLTVVAPLVEESVRRSAPWTALNVLDFDHLERGLDRWRVVLAVQLGGLGDAELERLRRWVRTGGTLIAVGDSFRHDADGRELPDFALADVLGLSWQGRLAVSSSPVADAGNAETPPKGLTISGPIPDVRAGAGCTLATVRASGRDIPVWHERADGAGRWVYVATQLPMDLLWHVLRRHAGPPPVSVAPADKVTVIASRQPSKRRWILHVFGEGEAEVVVHRRRMPAGRVESVHPAGCVEVDCDAQDGTLRLRIRGTGDHRIVALA